MDVRKFSKKPLDVDAFRFDAVEASHLLRPGHAEITVGQATLRRQAGGLWHVYNPGRAAAEEDPWQPVRHGDYVIVAPTGCRYPVQADQFERNYAEGARVPEIA